jgi:uncharacterized membrane protein YwaF
VQNTVQYLLRGETMLYFDFVQPYLMYLITVGVTIFLIRSIFLKTKFINKHKKTILIIITILLAWTQFARYAGIFFDNGAEWSIWIFNFKIHAFNLRSHLPFYMCRISVVVLLYYVITKDKRVESFLFYWGALGLAGVLYPNGEFTNSVNLTETFYIDHILLTVTPFFLIVYQKYVPTFKDVIIISSLMFVILVSFIFFNQLLDTDYFYLEDQSIFAVLFGQQPKVLFAFVHSIVAMGFFSAYYIMFRNKEFEG